MRKILFIAAVLFFVLSFVVLYVSPGAIQSLQANLNNSDLLFPFSLFQGLLNPASRPDWLFGAYTPFVELLAGFAFWLASRNAQITFALYAVFQPVLVTLCLLYLAASLTGKNWKVFTLVVVFSTAPVLAYASGLLPGLFYLFSWYLHVSTTCLGLIVLGAILRYTTFQPKERNLLLKPLLVIFLCTLIAMLSDAIFLSQFVAPILCLLLFMTAMRGISFRRAVFAGLTLLYATAAGLGLYMLPRAWGADRLVLYGSYMRSDPTRLFANLPYLWKKILEMLAGQNWMLVVWAAFYLLCLLAAWSILKEWRHTRPGAVRMRYLMVMIFLPVQMAASLAATLITNDPSIRYFVPAIYMPLFWGWPVLLISQPNFLLKLRVKRAAVFSYALPAILLIVIAKNLIATPPGGLADLSNYYPEAMACIDQKASELGLSHGIAQYWQARYTTLLSKTGLVVAPVNPDLSPVLILNNSDDYHADFDFAIIDHNPPYLAAWVNREMVVSRFGEPAKTFPCGQSEVLVYDRASDSAFRRQFDRATALIEIQP